VQDRLSGKPGAKVSSLIKMYREKEQLASSSKGSLGKSAGTSSQQEPPEPPAPVAKESTLLPPPPPPQPDLLLPTLDSPGMEQEGELEGFGEDYIEAPNFELDHGWESPYRYIHGAPLHNVVEEEEEE
jgi:hypothetical protein